MRKLGHNLFGRASLAILVLAAVTCVYYRYLHVNPATVGFTFLLGVLVVAASWGLFLAIAMVVAATLVYNYFFLPPVGHFTIADPQNWVALAVFLITAVIASDLAERARREALLANRRRYEVERLYAFSQELLATDNVLELFNAIPPRIVSVFGGAASAMYVREGERIYYSDLAAPAQIPADALREVAARANLR